jgi:hypothetical protein
MNKGLTSAIIAGILAAASSTSAKAAIFYDYVQSFRIIDVEGQIDEQYLIQWQYTAPDFIRLVPDAPSISFIPDTCSASINGVAIRCVEVEMFSTTSRFGRFIDNVFVAGTSADFEFGAIGRPGVWSGNVGATLTITDLSAAIPEPASWAMMIAGFGLVGMAARRHRRSAVTA